MSASQNPPCSEPLSLSLAERLFKRARPDQNRERRELTKRELTKYVETVLGHTIVIIPKVVVNQTDPDGRQFGWHRAGTLFGIIDPQGVAYEGSDDTAGAPGGRWDSNFTKYEFSKILPRGEKIVLIGERAEFREHYDEARAFQGGWVVTPIGKYPIEVELTRVETAS